MKNSMNKTKTDKFPCTAICKKLKNNGLKGGFIDDFSYSRTEIQLMGYERYHLAIKKIGGPLMPLHLLFWSLIFRTKKKGY